MTLFSLCLGSLCIHWAFSAKQGVLWAVSRWKAGFGTIKHVHHVPLLRSKSRVPRSLFNFSSFFTLSMFNHCVQGIRSSLCWISCEALAGQLWPAENFWPHPKMTPKDPYAFFFFDLVSSLTPWQSYSVCEFSVSCKWTFIQAPFPKPHYNLRRIM